MLVPFAPLVVLGSFFGPLAPGGTGCARDDGSLAPRAWDGRSHVVHEWGTFVAVAGSDGRPVRGLVHDPLDLPPFVYDLLDEIGLTGLSPKMETPVLYFHAPAPWSVHVRVDFPRGLVTQWFPAATDVNLRQRGSGAPPEHLDLEGGGTPLAGGYIEWGRFGELVVLGRAQDLDACSVEARASSAACFPAVAGDDPWRFSREVAANALRVTDYTYRPEDAESYAPRDQHERFLFYRGLGDFDLPLAARLEREEIEGGRARLALSLAAPDAHAPLAHVWLVVARDGLVALRDLGAVAGTVELELETDLAPASEHGDALARDIATRLARTGLYDDEALAMARTWQASWLGEEGVRLLYVLPPELVARELPLRVRGHDVPGPDGRPAPGEQPDEIVRTFVARVELLSPEREADIVATFARAASQEACAERDEARARIARWGRYARPYLERALALGLAPASGVAAETVLADLEPALR